MVALGSKKVRAEEAPHRQPKGGEAAKSQQCGNKNPKRGEDLRGEFFS